MQSFLYKHTEGNASVSVSLDLFDENTFRLTREEIDSFGSNEEIYNGTFLIGEDGLKLESQVHYVYSKYITDIEPSEIINNEKEEIFLKKEGNGYWLDQCFLAFRD